MSAHLGGEGRKEKEAAAAARTTEDLFGSTSESDTSTFHGFDEDDLEWMRFVERLKVSGMPIKEIREYIQLYLEGDSTIEERRKIVYYSDEPEDDAEADDDGDDAPATPATPAADLSAFGFPGPVQESFCNVYEAEDIDADVLTKGEPADTGDSEQGYSFTPDGRVTADPYGGVYSYDAEGRFKSGVSENTVMRRDGFGRVIYYLQQNGEEDDARYENKFSYDDRGRLVKVERTFWESLAVEEFYYEGDNTYPSERLYRLDEEGTVVESSTKYRYTKFDDQGNWTEREERYRGTTAEGDESSRTSWRGAQVVERQIAYY